MPLNIAKTGKAKNESKVEKHKKTIEAYNEKAKELANLPEARALVKALSKMKLSPLLISKTMTGLAQELV